MGCNGCPGDPKNTTYDKDGNVMNHPAEAVDRARHEDHGRAHASVREQARQMPYTEYLRLRKEFREKARVLRDGAVKEFTEDYKRIQIDELLSVYNLDEVHFKLTPDQALIALWEFSHDAAYQNVISEFEGLREAIDVKHAELQKNKIEIKWKP